VKFEEIGKATVSRTHQECSLKNVATASSSAVFTTSSRFYDVLLESKGAFYSSASVRRRRTRRSNKADRTKKTRGYLGVKRKKNNRSPISRSVPETCPKIPADIKNFYGRNERERENNDKNKRWNHVTDWFWKIENVCASYMMP